MGLSPDPEKRERQVANLRKGWAVNAERLSGPEPGKPKKPNLEVLEDAEPEPAKPKSKPKPKRPAATRKTARRPAAERSAPDPDPEPEPEPGGGALSEFWRGITGG